MFSFFIRGCYKDCSFIARLSKFGKRSFTFYFFYFYTKRKWSLLCIIKHYKCLKYFVSIKRSHLCITNVTLIECIQQYAAKFWYGGFDTSSQTACCILYLLKYLYGIFDTSNRTILTLVIKYIALSFYMD